MGKEEYRYNKCQAVKIIDGDTFDVLVDLGFHCSTTQRLRLQDFDTPEYYSPSCQGEKDFAIKVMAFVTNEIFKKPLTITTSKTDKYGRYVATITYVDMNGQVVSLKDVLTENKFAKSDLDCTKCEMSNGCTIKQ